MTSVLRRKRQITVRSTQPTKAPSPPASRSDVDRDTPPFSFTSFTQIPLPGLLTAIGLAGLLLALAGGLMPVVAEDSVIRDDAVRQVSYSTGQQGHQLKWLPTRPAKPRAGQVVPAQHLIDESSAKPLRLAQRPTPATDPFGDRGMPSPPMFDDRALPPPSDDPAYGLEPPRFSPDDLPADEPPSSDPPADEPVVTDPDDEVSFPSFGNGGRRIPTIRESLAAGSDVVSGECPRPEDILKPIGQLSTDTTPKDGEFPTNCPMYQEPFMPRSWAPTTYTWKASGLCHKPLYFEDVHLERYGHSWGPYVQPVLSGAHFFLTVPILPYKMGLYPPHECIYTLGYYRPGSCAPYLLDPLPLSVRAAVAQGGVMTGMAYLIP